MNKKVSIIMPVYNSENFLEIAINSVISQTYENFELIAVDDGSKDNSLEILKNFQKKDERIKVFSKENGGISSARNYGLRQATGNYITFLDNDDEYDKDLIKDNIELIQKYNSDIVKFNKIKRIFNEKNINIKNESAEFDFDLMILENDEIWKKFDIIYKFGGTIWNAIYKRDFLLNNDIWFDEKNKDVIEDHRFNYNCYKFLTRLVLNSKVYYYWNMRVQHSTSGKFNKKRFEFIKEESNNLYLLLIEKGIKKLNPNFWVIIKLSTLFNIMLVMNYDNSDFNFKTSKQYLKDLKKLELFKKNCRSL